ARLARFSFARRAHPNTATSLRRRIRSGAACFGAGGIKLDAFASGPTVIDAKIRAAYKRLKAIRHQLVRAGRNRHLDPARRTAHGSRGAILYSKTLTVCLLSEVRGGSLAAAGH